MIGGKTGLVIGIILLLVATPTGIIWFVVYGIMQFRRGGGSGRGGMSVGGSVDEMRSFPQQAQRAPDPSVASTRPYSPGMEAKILEAVQTGDGRLSVSALARELGVSESEVHTAIEDLAERGLIQL